VVTLRVTVPQGTTATVRVPGAAATRVPPEAVSTGGMSYEVGGGDYTFVSTL
jgi:hypothetical protein